MNLIDMSNGLIKESSEFPYKIASMNLPESCDLEQLETKKIVIGKVPKKYKNTNNNDIQV